VIALLSLALAQEPACDPPPTDEAVEALTYDISSGLRCPVCQGMSVADSSTEAAIGMKNQVEKLVREGYCPEQVEDYFIERYTTWILLEPPAEGSNWLIYTAPAVAVLLGLIVVATRRKRPQVPVAVRSDSGDAWRQKVLDELD
jgi:cytochrome c-type biogenesis protein CcmH